MVLVRRREEEEMREAQEVGWWEGFQVRLALHAKRKGSWGRG